MCLLAVLWHAHPDAALVVAANRDEWLARPAGPMQVLRAAGPRTLGGRDLLADGTWLAVNEHGVVAALTNRPPRAAGARDPARRSRGELPLLLTAHATARAAAAAFARTVRPGDYNPCWLLVGDRDSLHYLDLTGEGAVPPPEELAPGAHVLENRPLHVASHKADFVRARLTPLGAARGDALVAGLEAILRDHTVPDAARQAWHPPDPAAVAAAAAGGPPVPFMRPLETEAACVHAGPYGTRSATIVLVPPGPGAPRVRATDGPSCTTAWVDATSL
jgi:uncharacterized protein with NRDE domain